jgi:hypothetical protein
MGKASSTDGERREWVVLSTDDRVVVADYGLCLGSDILWQAVCVNVQRDFQRDGNY